MLTTDNFVMVLKMDETKTANVSIANIWEKQTSNFINSDSKLQKLIYQNSHKICEMQFKQAEQLKSRGIERWRVMVKMAVKVVMKVILSCLRGFASWQTDKWTDICECRVASATEELQFYRIRLVGCF